MDAILGLLSTSLVAAATHGARTLNAIQRVPWPAAHASQVPSPVVVSLPEFQSEADLASWLLVVRASGRGRASAPCVDAF